MSWFIFSKQISENLGWPATRPDPQRLRKIFTCDPTRSVDGHRPRPTLLNSVYLLYMSLCCDARSREVHPLRRDRDGVSAGQQSDHRFSGCVLLRGDAWSLHTWSDGHSPTTARHASKNYSYNYHRNQSWPLCPVTDRRSRRLTIIVIGL